MSGGISTRRCMDKNDLGPFFSVQSMKVFSLFTKAPLV